MNFRIILIVIAIVLFGLRAFGFTVSPRIDLGWLGACIMGIAFAI